MVYFRGKNIKFPLPAMKTAAWIFHSFIHGFFMIFFIRVLFGAV